MTASATQMQAAGIRLDGDGIRRALARRCVAGFAKYTDRRYKMAWHHALLCDCLDRFVAKDIRRLMVFMPPRHGKSELVSRKLPAYIFGVNPDASVIAASYSSTLARKMNRDVQRIIDGPEYGAVFPSTTLSGGGRAHSGMGANVRSKGRYARTLDEFEIVGHRGSYKCAGVGGGITGMGGDYIIIDDPVKNRKEANSLTWRDSLWDWYASTLYTRLEENAAILLTMTRWHEDDLAGKLLELAEKDPSADRWTVIELPAIYGQDYEKAPYDIREENMALWPQKYTYADLMRIKSTAGAYEWAALYQQRPQPVGGTIFKREWMNRTYRQLPAGARLIQSWDLPFKASEASAKCAGIVMARMGAEIFIVDVVNDKMAFTDSVTALKALSAKYPKARAKIVEDKANGPAIINYLQKDVPGMIAFNPKGSKEDRALSVAPYFEAGNVLFPESAPWKGDLIDELLRFPGSVYKDQTDATVQGILWLMDASNARLGAVQGGLGKESYWAR